MKLAEIVVCISIFLVMSVICLETFTNVSTKTKSLKQSNSTVNAVIKNDLLLRKKINEIELCYWKNFENETKEELEKIMNNSLMGQAKIISVTSVYDKLHNQYGIKVEWILNKQIYITQEFVKPGIINEKK